MAGPFDQGGLVGRLHPGNPRAPVGPLTHGPVEELRGLDGAELVTVAHAEGALLGVDPADRVGDGRAWDDPGDAVRTNADDLREQLVHHAAPGARSGGGLDPPR